MKKNLLLLLAFVLSGSIAFSQTFTGREATQKIPGSLSVYYKNGNPVPASIKLSKEASVTDQNFGLWIRKVLKLAKEQEFRKVKTEKDQLGFAHYTYQFYSNGHPVEGAVYKVHEREGKIVLINGNIPSVSKENSIARLSEKTALDKALQNINAQKYMWQNAKAEAHFKTVNNNIKASYYPKGELVVVTVSGKSVLAYKFDVYAAKPLQRYNIYVDASTGNVVKKIDRIRSCAKHHCNHQHLHDDGIEENNIVQSNSTGTGTTRYSGTQSITTDSYSGYYRLRETSRGNGVETYNMNSSEDYADAVDFVDNDNNWTSSIDNVAIDAHWGAQVTYDYYLSVHSRNSFDDLGKKLISYVHFGNDYDNAFWDGYSMSYGDGSNLTGGFMPLVSLDVVGHELTHGLTEHTAGLEYEYESGALNESFSDIFGTVIEYYKKPANANFEIGEQIMVSGGALRDMQNPNDYDQPDTYLGDFWDPFEEVHTNSGVGNKWFYILAQGESGTNDNSDSYSVTGIGLTKAAKIAYRMLSVYLTPTSDYADARQVAIYAATDLYGACSAEVQAVTNAWYAVGVGAPYTNAVIADFEADITSSCTLPAEISFTNLSTNGSTYSWDFGDGGTSTSANPTHTYTANGTYHVTLNVDGGACGSNDSEIKNAYIVINTNAVCAIDLPTSGTAPTQTACNGILRDNGGTSEYTSYATGIITIAPTNAATVTLTFSEFEFEDGFDFLYVYDGPNTTSPLIAAYTGSNLPNNGNSITSTTGSITIQQSTDQLLNEDGFTCSWTCTQATAIPTAAFIGTPLTSCDGEVFFTDRSTQGATSWQWNFGDGNTSTLQNPVHYYTSSGVYNISLTACNGFGCSSTLTKNSYINVNLSPTTCVTLMPSSGTKTKTSCAGILRDNGGTSNYDDNTNGTTVIKPTGANTVTLKFTSFNFEEDWDYLYIYDGENTAATMIGYYTGMSLPEGGTITSTGNAITIRQETDGSGTESGFVSTWSCNLAVGTKDGSENNASLVVFPNPANNDLQLHYSFAGSQSLNVSMYNSLGMEVFTDNGIFNTEYQKTLSVKDFAKGLYTVSFTNANGSKTTTKVVIE